MTQEEYSSKLGRLQGVLLDDQDFLKQVVQAFCQRLLEEEMTQQVYELLQPGKTTSVTGL